MLPGSNSLLYNSLHTLASVCTGYQIERCKKACDSKMLIKSPNNFWGLIFCYR